MKKAMRVTSLFCFLFTVLLLSNFSALAQKTTVWVVRHAEKDASLQGNDPVLSADGQRRALALARALKPQNLKAIYVTRLKRTGLTAKPLADQAKILPRFYTDSLKQYANVILKNFKGKNVLIVGHSNTIMPLLAAFGAEQPFQELADDDYDMLFKVTVKDSGMVDLEVSYYGKSHHSSILPQNYLLENKEPQPFNRPVTNY